MKYVILSDTHFGVKQNSITWLNSQVGFFKNELIPNIKKLLKEDEVTIIHCGDVFDSRSSINPMVAYSVIDAFTELCQLAPVYIVAGNHDFYSPNDDLISALPLTLGNQSRIHLVTDKYFMLNDNALVPWYVFDNEEVMKEIVAKKPKRIFCHTDLLHLTSEYKQMLEGITVYSGHIHTPHRDGNLITLGSTFALTFADCNDERGYHVIDDIKGTFHFVPAQNIIKFWRFHNEEIFSIDTQKIVNDYVELYIDKLNLLNDHYSDQISKITSKVKNVVVIPNEEKTDISESVEFANYDIDEICRKNIPEELKAKFEQISCKD